MKFEKTISKEKISEAHIREELQQQIKEAVDKEQKDKIQEDFDKRLEENNLIHKEKLEQTLKKRSGKNA